MKQLLNLLIGILFLQQPAFAQAQRTAEQDSLLAELRRQTQQDYQHMLQQLGIDSVRPGANGSDPNAPNAANYDESRANPYPELPDPLTLSNGQKVTSAKVWWNPRRAEIMEDFDREIYGRVPSNTPAVNWEVVETLEQTLGAYPVVIKKLIGHVDNSRYPDISVDIELSVTTPAEAEEAVPLIMQFSFHWPAWFSPRPDGPRPEGEGPPEWQLLLLKQGWGFAELLASSIQADHGAGLTEGIIGLVNRGERRKPEDWGSLRAWAWGASRAMDYLETDEDVDAAKVGITGHSRYGKAVAVTMAYDQRFATAYISSSGAGGVKLHRRNAGEIVENVAAASEYHWMAGNYIQYAGPLHWDDLPVDAHELLALCAPRPVFVGSGNEGDGWVDPRGMFMACVAASPVYELLGKEGLEAQVFPPVESSLLEGDIAFRQHNEGHTPAPNWPYFIKFASRYFE